MVSEGGKTTAAGISSVMVSVTIAGVSASAGLVMMSDDLSKPHCIQNLAPGSNGVPHCGQKFIALTFKVHKIKPFCLFHLKFS